jgi:hypothetical protein
MFRLKRPVDRCQGVKQVVDQQAQNTQQFHHHRGDLEKK